MPKLMAMDTRHCLAAEFAKSPTMFHAIFACHFGSRLAGIGAITDEPAPTLQPTWRMRRLYVDHKFRPRKIARTIAIACCKRRWGKPRLRRCTQAMMTQLSFGRQLDFTELSVGPGLTKQERWAQLLAYEVRKWHDADGLSRSQLLPQSHVPQTTFARREPFGTWTRCGHRHAWPSDPR